MHVAQCLDQVIAQHVESGIVHNSLDCISILSGSHADVIHAGRTA